MILVAGSEGFIGRRITLALQDKGFEVWGTSNAKPTDSRLSSIPIVTLSESGIVRKTPDFEIIINAIGNYSNSSEYINLKKNIDSNSLAPLLVTRFANEATRNFLHIGSYFEFAPLSKTISSSQYTLSKILGRKSIEQYFTNSSTNFIGCILYDNYCEDLSRGKLLDQLILMSQGKQPISINNLKNQINLTHLDDVVEGIVEMALSKMYAKKTNLQIKYPKTHSVREIVEMVQEITQLRLITTEHKQKNLENLEEIWDCAPNWDMKFRSESLEDYLLKMISK